MLVILAILGVVLCLAVGVVASLIGLIIYALTGRKRANQREFEFDGGEYR